MASLPQQIVRRASTEMVKPSPSLPESVTGQRLDLSPWDLKLLTYNYIQWGFLFPSHATDEVITHLRSSLSRALHRFYPFAARLKTEGEDDGIVISVDLNAVDGVEFIHAVADEVSTADLADHRRPAFIRAFFPLDGAVNHDAHFRPFLGVQVTELSDGFFLGCSFNHAIGDGTSFMNFLKSWSEICCKQVVGKDLIGGAHPVHERWFSEGVPIPLRLPFTGPEEFVDRYFPPPELEERMFHLSSYSVSELKLKANKECDNGNKSQISTFQALASLLWRCMTRARRLSHKQETTCLLAVNNRPRLQPPLLDEYSGCCVQYISVTTTVGELINHGLGWGAMVIHRSILAHTDGAIRDVLKAWVDEPVIYRIRDRFDPSGMTIDCSPRFDLYGCDFGWGRASGVRTGGACKYDGKVAMFMGREGGKSVDVEIVLAEESMDALQSDEEFMSIVLG